MGSDIYQVRIDLVECHHDLLHAAPFLAYMSS
jgi:hypothetical protein